MALQRLLIMDLGVSSCAAERYAKFPELIEQRLSGEPIQCLTTGAFPPPRLPHAPDLILLRPSSDTPVSDVLRPIKERWARAPILGLFCSERASPNDVWHSLDHGLDDFLFCPFNNGELLLRLRRLMARNAGHPGPALDRAGRFRIDSLIGDSPRFMRAVEKIPLLANSDATVLITGETGTGKELFARAIHYHSPRKGKPFIPVNCGALPEQLFENELFGHAKGAFTHAVAPTQGLAAEAEGGTLFLDEVDTLSLSAQTKLLRFLQDRQYRPLGSSKSIAADVRILCATNADLRRMVEHKQMREDLYYRLNVLSLCVPPLRERLDDIPRLADHFLDRYGRRMDRQPPRLSPEAIRKLLAYPWSGNVRELEGVVQRAVVLTPSPLLQPDDLDLPVFGRRETAEGRSLREAKDSAIGEFERTFLVNLLAAHRGNVTRAAEAAGKDRRTFQRLLKKHSVERHAFKPIA